jgi:hypothetical protein
MEDAHVRTQINEMPAEAHIDLTTCDSQPRAKVAKKDSEATEQAQGGDQENVNTGNQPSAPHDSLGSHGFMRISHHQRTSPPCCLSFGRRLR